MTEGHRPAGRLALHPDTRGVTLDGRTVRLSRKEFQILALLAAEPDTVHTAAELARRVWDYLLPPGGEPAIDVEVARIRAKLGHPPFLHSVHGEGHRLDSSALYAAGPAHAEGADPE
ncbi:winged helix-turn-helix domain-containing protein [Streptomyces sp. NPDC102462]|uniref:winged helix-turn-helix domain-containing protein n=1 Tax=Streptomyces sp. NPDC102462 TaxID=3366178 RepID=UPI00382EFD29